MISQGWKNQRRAPETPPLKVMRVGTGGAQRAGWLDSMLGSGSSRTVQNAAGRFRRAAASEADPGSGQGAVLRMRAVGSGAELPAARKPKGYLRLGLALLALGLLAKATRPWEAFSPASMPALLRIEKPAVADAKIPVVDSGGEAVALWRSESGQWYGVDAKAGLSRMSEKEAHALLMLPRLEGAALASEEARGGRLLRLQIEEGLLEALLPLRRDLAAELDAVQIQGKRVRLRIQGGTLADLGEGEFKEKQARLVSVLADLHARKKRAQSVDLRFENTAVVRLASR